VARPRLLHAVGLESVLLTNARGDYLTVNRVSVAPRTPEDHDKPSPKATRPLDTVIVLAMVPPLDLKLLITAPVLTSNASKLLPVLTKPTPLANAVRLQIVSR
jgi:hypothetical protein